MLNKPKREHLGDKSGTFLRQMGNIAATNGEHCCDKQGTYFAPLRQLGNL